MIVWISFLVAVLIFLALDLGVFNKTPHIISTKEAGKWTAIWITLSFLFSGVIYWLYETDYIANPDNLKPATASIKFITGYLIELSYICYRYNLRSIQNTSEIPAPRFILGNFRSYHL